MDQRFNPEPDVSDALDIHKDEIFLGFNCHAIAIIQSFNLSKQTVQATIAYKKTYIDEAGDDVYVDYPLLVDVPVIVLGGGKANLTMPIAKGDECLILFNDRDIDAWFSGGGVAPLDTDRMHDFADGFALVGVRSLNRSIAGYSSDRAELMNDKAKVSVGPQKIKIANDTKSLATILQSLLTALAGAMTTNAVPGNPSAFAPSTITAIQQAATDLGGLLE